MLVTTIWVLFVAQSFAKDLAPHAHQQTLNENVGSRTRMTYYYSMSNPHYKINFIYEQRKTNEVTEIEQIEEEIGKHMHHHHQPTTMTTTTTEAQQNIEVVNEKDIKETTNHSSSETPITIIEKHHHKHEEKEVTSTLTPMPPAPKLREPFIAVHPHFPTALPAKVKNELKQLLAHELRRIPHRHPDHRLHISRTTSEAPVELEARTELSPLVTQPDEILNSDVPESHLNHPDPPAHKLRPISQRHLDHRPLVSQTTSEAHVGEEGQMELSPLVTQLDNVEEIPTNDVQGSLDNPDSPSHELRPTPHRHSDHRLHISRSTSEAPVKEKARTNHASTEKGIHLSPTSHDPSFLSRKDQNALAKIRTKFEDVQHGSIGLPSRPRPVYRGSYKFSWADINDMHASAVVPKVSQLKENPNSPPVPTLSPWYDGYGK